MLDLDKAKEFYRRVVDEVARVLEDVFGLHYVTHCCMGVSGVIAEFDPGGGLLLYSNTQVPFLHKREFAEMLGIDPARIRIIQPPIGGGFGSKIFIYPEEVVCLWAARRVRRPVKWVAERTESFVTDAHGRDHVTHAELALDANGKILALRAKTIANLGAYMSTFSSSVPTYLYGTLLAGTYTTPAIYVETKAVFTNTVPVDAYRGAGRPEATFLLERIVDVAADEAQRFIGLDALHRFHRCALEIQRHDFDQAADRDHDQRGLLRAPRVRDAARPAARLHARPGRRARPPA